MLTKQSTGERLVVLFTWKASGCALPKRDACTAGPFPNVNCFLANPVDYAVNTTYQFSCKTADLDRRLFRRDTWPPRDTRARKNLRAFRSMQLWSAMSHVLPTGRLT